MNQTERAKSIGVSRRTYNTWKAKGAPVDDDLAMAKWLVNQKINRTEVKKWMKKTFESHEKELVEESGGGISDKDKKSLETIRDYYQSCLTVATEANDRDSIKYWNELLLKTDESIRRSQAHERKLGLEQGETIKREEVERIIDAILFAGNACVRNQIKELCQGISMKTPAEIYRVLPAAILGGRIFEGLAAVVKSDSEVQVPQWMVDRFIDEGGNYLKRKSNAGLI